MSLPPKTKPNYLHFFVSSLLVVLVLFFAFRIRIVNCQYENLNQQEITQVCQELNQAFVGKSLLFSDLEQADIWQKLLEHDDYQETYHLVKMSKSLPSTVTLHLNSKPPDYRLKIEDKKGQGNSYIINQNNRLKKNQAELNVLNIIYQGEKEILDNNNAYLTEDYHQLFLTWHNAIDHWEIPVKAIIWQSNELIKLDLGRSWLVILDLQVDFTEKMRVLAAIISDEESLVKIQEHQFLDLRFNLPVIRDQL